MKYTKTMACLGLIASVSTAQAAIISLNSFSNTDHASTGTQGNGNVSGTGGSVDGDASAGSTDATVFDVSTFVVDNSASSTGNLAYTVSGLDIDGSGGFNDSFVISFTVSGDGQNLQTKWNADDSAPENAGWLSSGGDLLNAAAEYLQIDYNSITVNLNGGSGNGTGTWLGFTAAGVGGFSGSEVAVFNGITLDNSVDTSKSFDFTGADVAYDIGGGNTNDASLLADRRTAAGGSGGWRPESWSFQVDVTAVPEPSAAALLGLAGLALILRRRK
jgi:hypothetical protein